MVDIKTVFAFGMECVLGGILIASWSFGKDGIISTAIFAMMGTIAGSVLGFHFGSAS